MEEISPEPMKPRPVKAKPIRAKDDDDREPCPYCGELIKEGATRCKHCGEDLDEVDDDEDDRPSRRRSKRGSRRGGGRGAAHRGGMVMTLGIISVSLLVVDFGCSCCGGGLGIMISTGISAVGLGLGIPAWIMGQKDLARMRNGDMDESGRGTTQTGWICGLIGTILHGLGVVCGGILLVFFVAVQGASIMSTGSPFGGGGPSNPPPGRRFEAPGSVPRFEDYLPNRWFISL